MEGKKKILLVEDEKLISKVLSLKLQHSGYLVKIAINGQQAIDFMKQEKFDLVLLDIIMPVKNGFDVLKELQQLGDKTKVIMTTNLSQDEDKINAKALGAIDYYVKSNTSLAEIVEQVKKILN